MQVFHVDNVNTLVRKVDYQSVLDSFEILNFLLARWRQDFALELTAFLVDVEWIVNGLLVLENVVTVIQVYLLICLDIEEVPYVLHIYV